MTVASTPRCLPLCIALLLCLGSSPAHAFGPRTHAFLATRVLEDVRRDCRVDIAGRRYPLTAEACDSIRNWPGYFLAGAEGADNFPDPLTARATLNHGADDNAPAGTWQSGDWLHHVVHAAAPGPALAFAMGTLLHAGHDVFANSYINTFAGGRFAPGTAVADVPDIAARHRAIEQYLDAHVPDTAGAVRPEWPADFLRQTLLFNADAVAQYRRNPAAAHIVAMHEARSAVENMTFAIEALEDMATEMQRYYTGGDLPVGAPPSMPEFSARLQAHDAIQRHLDAASRAVDDTQKQLAAADSARSAAADVVASTGKEQEAATLSREGFAAALAELQKKSARIPRDIEQENCHSVRKWISKSEWTTNRVCMPQRAGNPARAEMDRRLVQLQQDLMQAGQRITTAAAARKSADAALKAAQENVLRLDARLHQAEVASLAADGEYRNNLATLLSLPLPQPLLDTAGSVPASRRALQSERERMLHALQDALDDLHALSFIGRNWESGMDRAGAEYLQVSRQAGMPAAHDDILQAYRHWFGCSGAAFRTLAVSPAIAADTMDEKADAGTSDCNASIPYAQATSRLQRLERDLRAPGLGELNEAWLGVKKSTVADMQRHLQDAERRITALLAPEGVVEHLATQIEDQIYANRSTVQLLLAGRKEDDGLLTVRNGADIIDADAGIRGDAAWNPDAFHAVQYADRLGRMALLSGRELNRLATQLGGHPDGHWFSRWMLHPEGEPRYSLFYSALRSMDGNQQWQPYGLPYARINRSAEPQDAGARHYSTGLAIFTNPLARKRVFTAIFPAPLSLLETHPRLQAPAYPFPSCRENPFPVAFDAVGNPASADPGCAVHEVVQQ